jgi:hypothetical protein
MKVPDGYRVVERSVYAGEQFYHHLTGKWATWGLNTPSTHQYDVLERIPSKRKLLVIVWEIVEHPANTLTQMSPALAEAWVTPAYAEGVVKAGYVARIIDAPDV